MKKSIVIFIIAATGLFSCKQGSKSTPETVDIETVNSVRNYEYTNSKGGSLVIQNGLPKGGMKYIDPNGDSYHYIVFWTRIINETNNPLELKMEIPVDSYEVPSLPDKYYKILIPTDTMTLEKIPLFNYGLTGLEYFLDNSILKLSSLKRTINQKESSGFYVVMLSLTADLTTEGRPGSTLRTGLILKGQNLFYRISRYASTAGHPLISEKEINCGSINLKNLMLRK
jgi:hypothetical protein